MSLASVTGVFPSATVSSGVSITIPQASIVSFNPNSATDPGGYELIFGLLESMHQKVGTNYDNLNSTVSSRLVDSGQTIRRTYTFDVDLLFADNDVANLNVRPTGTPWFVFSFLIKFSLAEMRGYFFSLTMTNLTKFDALGGTTFIF